MTTEDPGCQLTAEQRTRLARENAYKARAQREQRCITYTDTDGCEVTATPSGHTFYNAADWW